jgi:acylphosphatase
MARESRHIHFKGNVQGVGFRWTTRRAAADHAVTGYVKNLPDGRVELYVEGDPAEIDSFLEQVRRDLGQHIRGETTQTGPASGRFSGFEIRH